MSMGKTYFIRKVGVQGGGSSRTLKKKKQVLVSFPHSTTPLSTYVTIIEVTYFLHWQIKAGHFIGLLR